MSTAKAERPAIQPTRAEDFPQWYQQVVRAADLAENSEVRGCMVIKPWGYGIWEQIQSQLDRMFKDTGHQNAYFPLLIPLSHLEKEAQHAEGFATECAVVTHHRLETQRDASGAVRLVPAGPLTEPLVVRPTSETIIGSAFARWIQSYRDLPLLLNQWANVMRWEMRPRLFLRTSEFLWQEGHTAHETREEAYEETLRILRLYETFMRDHLALPVITGAKTENERFPGAEETLCLETMVQDRKAIQAGTSHFLGQNFSRASNIQFQGRDGSLEYAWTTSWGVSTRLIGTVIMTHGDDNGIIVPPRVAPTHVVILPVIPREDVRAAVCNAADHLAADLQAQTFHGQHLSVHVDQRELNGGVKNWEWIKKGVPVRIEIGPRDLESGNVSLSRRDLGPKHRELIPATAAAGRLSSVLHEIQRGLLDRAERYSRENSANIDSQSEFDAYFQSDTGGGFALAHWAGTSEDEARIKDKLQVTIRCIPLDPEFEEDGACFLTGWRSRRRVIFARSY